MTSPWPRRRFLLSTIGFGLARPAGAAPLLRVLVAGGHPGDPEYGCGGTIARYAGQGHAVTMLYLNRGEGANEGPPACRETGPDSVRDVRVQEAANAARILGAETAFLDQCNAHAVVDDAAYATVARVVRDLAPDVMFNQWPIDNHPDHRALSSLIYQAWISLNRGPALYYYEVSGGEDTEMFHPTDYVDIGAEEGIKRAACYAHQSQHPDRYYALQTLITRMRGAEAGCAQAEAFVRHARSRAALLP